MSTRAQIAIQTGPGEWAHIYCHFDGYPSHMLPALAPWKPEDILAAKEIRQVRADALDCFDPPREPPILPRPTCELLWLPPVMQEVFDRIGVIECALLLGLKMRHFQKPRAEMVISGLGPNLYNVLIALSSHLVFPIQISSIVLPIQVVVFSHPLGTGTSCST